MGAAGTTMAFRTSASGPSPMIETVPRRPCSALVRDLVLSLFRGGRNRTDPLRPIGLPRSRPWRRCTSPRARLRVAALRRGKWPRSFHAEHATPGAVCGTRPPAVPDRFANMPSNGVGSGPPRSWKLPDPDDNPIAGPSRVVSRSRSTGPPGTRGTPVRTSARAGLRSRQPAARPPGGRAGRTGARPAVAYPPAARAAGRGVPVSRS